jgi:lysophospholipase-3
MLVLPLLLSASSGDGNSSSLAPVVLIPGLAGSVIYAKLDNVKPAKKIICKKTADWYRIWVNTKELVPEQKDCLVSNMMLHYNATSDVYSNTPGVTLDTNYHFGTTDSVKCLDPSLCKETGYFDDLIDYLVEEFGYVAGSNLHGAGYDWRLAADAFVQPGNYYDKLQELIETTVGNNTGGGAHLIAHSLGGPTTLAFLNSRPSEWKQKYVASLISLSGVFGGAAEMAYSAISGDNFGVPIVPHDYLRPVQASAASGTWMLPIQAAFGNDRPIIFSSTKNYTTNDWMDMLDDLGLDQAAAILKNQESKHLSMTDLKPPDVEWHLMYGTGVKTGREYHYKGDFTPSFSKDAAKVVYADGDGTVNLDSLTWPERAFGPSISSVFNASGVSHFKMVSDKGVLAQIAAIIQAQ